MPEASMDEYNSAKAREDQIGVAREVRDVKAVSQPCAMQEAAQCQFRLGVGAPDPGHAFRPLAGSQGIGHGVQVAV